MDECRGGSMYWKSATLQCTPLGWMGWTHHAQTCYRCSSSLSSTHRTPVLTPQADRPCGNACTICAKNSSVSGSINGLSTSMQWRLRSTSCPECVVPETAKSIQVGTRLVCKLVAGGWGRGSMGRCWCGGHVCVDVCVCVCVCVPVPASTTRVPFRCCMGNIADFKEKCSADAFSSDHGTQRLDACQQTERVERKSVGTVRA